MSHSCSQQPNTNQDDTSEYGSENLRVSSDTPAYDYDPHMHEWALRGVQIGEPSSTYDGQFADHRLKSTVFPETVSTNSAVHIADKTSIIAICGITARESTNKHHN